MATEYSRFEFQPTGTGVISGRETLRQTEDGINNLGESVYQAETDAAEALALSKKAIADSEQALNDASAALGAAEAAQESADTAQATANNAVTAAQGAQAAAQGAAQTAQAAAQSAANAQTAAENAATAAAASETKADQAVQTANQAATTAGQAVTTAGNAVTRATQAETNVQNAVNAANQAAQSAQDSASAASLLANPNRYSAKTTTLTLSAGQTVNISDLDNANVAVGNKIVDALGNVFEIASIDTEAGTITLVAADSTATPPTTGFWENPAVRVSGAQSVSGVKTFADSPLVPTLARFDQSQKAINSAWAYGLVTQGNALELVDLGTPDDLPWDEIDAGNFRNCPVGGYVTKNSHRYYLGHHNYWLHTGDTGCTTDHILVVPATNLVSGQMNSTNTTSGGYAGCDFKTGNNGNTKLADLTTIINADWGASHILSHREHFTNAVTSGYPLGGAWYDSTIDLMSEPMVYGCKIFEPIGNGSFIPNNYTPDKQQIKLFAERPDLITIRANWWLRGVVSAAAFAGVSNNGLAGVSSASNSLGFRPAFGIRAS